MTTTTILTTLLELEAQADQAGWDQGCGLWGLHAHEDDLSDLLPMKLGGPDYIDLHPLELIGKITPPPPCYLGMALSFECWTSAPGEEKIDTRYVVGVTRAGVCWLVEHVRGRKPKAWLVDSMRLLTMSQATAEVCSALRDFVLDMSPGLPPGMPPEIASVIQRLLNGGEPPEGFGGFIIMGGGA